MIIVKNQISAPGGLFERGLISQSLFYPWGLNREGALFETGSLFDHLRYIKKTFFETSVAGEFFLCLLCRSGSILPDLHNDPTVYNLLIIYIYKKNLRGL